MAKISKAGAYEDFSIQLPKQMDKIIHRADKSDAYLTYDNTTVRRKATDFSVEVYPSESLQIPSPCTSSLTGASKTNALADTSGNTVWGKVDFFEQYGSDGHIDYVGPQPLCAQPGSAIFRYALCSEKNGKTVIICISQMNDAPELAEKIFETFRWTK